MSDATLAALPHTSDGRNLLPIMRDMIALEQLVLAFAANGPRLADALNQAATHLDSAWQCLLDAASRDANSVRSIIKSDAA